MQFTVNTIEDWDQVIEKIAPLIKHNILLLKGDLGAGKTTFTQKYLDFVGGFLGVSSPTYSIVNEYQINKKNIYHFDLYRLNSPNEVLDIGIEEYLDSGNLCIIEWPEIYEEQLVDWQYHTITIENLDSGRIVCFH